MTEESIDQRNSMSPPYRYWTEEEKYRAITEDEIEQSKKLRERLEALHILKPQVDIWQNIEKKDDE